MEAQTAKFALGPNAAVFTEDGRRVEPGSEERGMVAVGGRLPEGYYKDPEKTAKTFPILEGRRWCVPGRLGDGEPRRHLEPARTRLGLYQHRRREGLSGGGGGIPQAPCLDPRRRGGRIARCALWRAYLCGRRTPKPGAVEPGLTEIAAHVKGQLADYKSPRSLVVVDTVGRAPNGKVDYKGVKARAMAALGIAA